MILRLWLLRWLLVLLWCSIMWLFYLLIVLFSFHLFICVLFDIVVIVLVFRVLCG